MDDNLDAGAPNMSFSIVCVIFCLRWMGSFGALTPKPTVLFGTASGPPKLKLNVVMNCAPRPWSKLLYRKMTRALRSQLLRRLVRKGGPLVKVYYDKKGHKKVAHASCYLG